MRLGNRNGPLFRDVCGARLRDRDGSVREPAIRAREGDQRVDYRRTRRSRAHSGLGRDRIGRGERGWRRARREPRRADRVHRGDGLAVGCGPSLGVRSGTRRRRGGDRRGSRLDPGSADGGDASRGSRITLARTGRGDAPGDCDAQRDSPTEWRSHHGPESGTRSSWRDLWSGRRSASRGGPRCRMVRRVHRHLLRSSEHRRRAAERSARSGAVVRVPRPVRECRGAARPDRDGALDGSSNRPARSSRDRSCTRRGRLRRNLALAGRRCAGRCHRDRSGRRHGAVSARPRIAARLGRAARRAAHSLRDRRCRVSRRRCRDRRVNWRPFRRRSDRRGACRIRSDGRNSACRRRIQNREDS